MLTAVNPAALKKNALRVYKAALKVQTLYPHAHDKEEWLLAGVAFLRNVRAALGVDADIRTCPGGIAVAGEAVLHSDGVYVMLHSSAFGTQNFMYRPCRGRNDFTGGKNRWYGFAELADDPQAFIGELRSLIRGERSDP